MIFASLASFPPAVSIALKLGCLVVCACLGWSNLRPAGRVPGNASRLGQRAGACMLLLLAVAWAYALLY